MATYEESLNASRSQPGDQPTEWVRRPRLSWADLVLQLWRAKWLMLGVALPILGLGLLAVFSLPRTYEAVSRLYVGLGQEYVFQPLVGDAARGAIPEQDRVIQAEMELLGSPVIAERVLREVGLTTVFPKLAEKLATATPQEADAVFQESVVGLQKEFDAGAAPKTPVIRTSFTHEDPVVAARVLNAIIETYLSYRREVLVSRETGAFGAQREDFAVRLKTKEQEIQQFLTANGISDFEGERTANQALVQEIQRTLSTVDAGLREAEGRYQTLRARLDQVRPEIELFTESNASQRLLDLELERRQLLSRYTETSLPVQEVDRRISEARSLIENEGRNAGVRRTGPNPTYQDVETQTLRTEAEVNSQRERVAALRAQLSAAQAKVSTLTRLQPQYQALLRERDVLDTNVRGFAAREEEERALVNLSERSAENIRVMEPARPPPKGKSLRVPAALALVAFAGLTALIAGLIYALTRDGFATAGTTARTLGLPVLASVRRR
jgi:uncharacterized protein involved in exopolysaccharide biosynthesis